MRRGTTPTYKLVADADLIGQRVIVTLRGQGNKVDLDGDRLTMEPDVDGGGNAVTNIYFTLTQPETLRFTQPKAYAWDDPKRLCKVQIRTIDEHGVANASDMADIDIRPILKDGVISYE